MQSRKAQLSRLVRTVSLNIPLNVSLNIRRHGWLLIAARRWNTATNNILKGYLPKFAILHHESRFHFDKYMWMGGMWFRSLRDYLPQNSNSSLESNSIENRVKFFVKLWCYFLAFFIIGPDFIRWMICWVWSGPTAVYWLQDVSAVLGGSRFYHLPQITLWAGNACVVIASWWRLQAGDVDLFVHVLKPFIAVHHPREARLMG